MNKRMIAGAAAICALLASSTFAIAQHDEHGNGGKPQNSQRPTNTRTAPVQKQTYGSAYHGGVRSDGPTNGGVHHSGVPQQETQVRAGFGQSRANTWQSEHQTWTQRGGYNGYRIPDNRFRLYFGHDHFFRIGGLPMVFVGGMPRFQYDGFWFTMMDPWPEDWTGDWYDSDDVYVDYDGDGYYLYNRNHPGIRLALTASF
jgi:hypothetical protein